MRHDCDDDDEEADGEQGAVPRSIAKAETATYLERQNHRRDREGDQQKEGCRSYSNGFGVANCGRIRRVFELWNKHDGHEAEERQKCREGSGLSHVDAAQRKREGQPEEAADCGAIDDDTGQQADALLHFAADHLGLWSFALCLIQAGLKCDGSLDLGLADPAGKRKGKKTRDDANQHPAQEQSSNDQGVLPTLSGVALVAGEAKQMAAIMKKLVDGAAVDQRGGALLRTDEIDRQQHQEPAEDGPGQKLAEGDGRDGDWRMDGTGNRLCHDETSWDRASQIKYELTTKEGLALGDRFVDYSGATAPEFHRLLRFIFNFWFERRRLRGQCQDSSASQ
jgi:hypothetical protein